MKSGEFIPQAGSLILILPRRGVERRARRRRMTVMGRRGPGAGCAHNHRTLKYGLFKGSFSLAKKNIQSDFLSES